jgi:hypothetical protein
VQIFCVGAASRCEVYMDTTASRGIRAPRDLNVTAVRRSLLQEASPYLASIGLPSESTDPSIGGWLMNGAVDY